MSIYYSKSTGSKLVVVAKTAAKRVKMAISYGLKHNIVDFTEVSL